MLDDELKTKLLNAIINDSLVVVCGAGLSMALPSDLPSAAALAQMRVNRHRGIFGHNLPDDLEDVDLEAIAQYYLGRNELKSVFLQSIVLWEVMRNAPINIGHIALADFLSCGALQAIISTNFDSLIESASAELGEQDFEPCLDSAFYG